MKTHGAMAFLPFLTLVLQASLCLASRPEASRSLLQTSLTTLAAGASCRTDGLCSNGDGTTSKCPSASSNCPAIPAGKPCKAKDTCRGDAASTQICPADPATTSGVCPLIPAGGTCLADDSCASDATKSILCPITKGNVLGGTCPKIALGGTCSSLAGECTLDELCSSPPPTLDFKNPSALQLYQQDNKSGKCVLPKGAGRLCTPGTDICSGQGENYAAAFCSSSPCPQIRAGKGCSKDLPTDICFDGTAEGVECPAGAGDHNGVTTVADYCPKLPNGATCYATDICDGTAKCNAVGTAPGKCVTTKAAGGGCVAAEFCPVTLFDANNDFYEAAIVCPGSACPLRTAGYVCTTAADKCNIGTDSPATCGSSLCDSIVGDSDALKCYENDKCADSLSAARFCSGRGATAGVCTVAVPAGAKCTAKDVCYPTGDLCPTSLTCPVIPAGNTCKLAVSEEKDPDTDAVTVIGRVADKCSAGGSDTIDCPSGNLCPKLLTGQSCSPSDLCVKGAKCIQDKCYPNSKVFDSPSPPPPPAQPAAVLSNATSFPAIKSVVRFTNFAFAAFTKTEEGKFCAAVEASISRKYNGLTSECTVTSVTDGSVSVANTVAFTGQTGAEAAQKDLTTLLKANSATALSDVFGTTYGPASVSSVEAFSETNPSSKATSGAAAVGVAWTVGVALMISALVLTV